MRNKKRYYAIWGLVLCILLVGVDQLTKSLVRIFLSEQNELEVIPGVFELFYLQNRGAAFGVLNNRQWLFISMAGAMVLFAIYVYLRTPLTRQYHFLRVLCILVVSGAVGNMIDRMVNHYVTDFIYFSLINFPVFNIADCYICVGAGLAAISIFTVYRNDDFAFLHPPKYKKGDS